MIWLLAGCGGGGTLDQNGFEELMTLIFIGIAIIVVVLVLIAVVIAVGAAALAGAGAAVGRRMARATMPEALQEPDLSAYRPGSTLRSTGPPPAAQGAANRMAGRAVWIAIWMLGVPFLLFFLLVGLPMWWLNR